MNVGGVLMVASAFSLAGCATAALREDAPVRAPVGELVSLTPIVQGIFLGDGLTAQVGAARGPGGIFMTLHLPVAERFDGRRVQTIVFEPGFLPRRIYRVDMDGVAPAELVIEPDRGLLNQWTAIRAQSDRRGPGYWHRSAVPEELIDLELLGAELVLDFDPADYR